MSRLSYLASPYNSPDPLVETIRYSDVLEVAARYLDKKEFVYSPIVHNITIDNCTSTVSQGWELWRDFDFLMLSKCDRLLVLMLDGWKESVGVTAEIAEATRLGIPIEYISYNDEVI